MKYFLAPALALLCSPALAATWLVDAQKSSITFIGTQESQPFEGKIAGFDAAIEFDPAALATSKVEVTVPVAGISAGSAMRDSELPKAEWFDFGRFPVAKFTARKFGAGDPLYYTAHGELTLRDVTLPLELPFKLEIFGDTAHMTGEVQLDRTAFGIGQGEWADGSTVGKMVTVKIDLTATRAP